MIIKSDIKYSFLMNVYNTYGTSVCTSKYMLSNIRCELTIPTSHMHMPCKYCLYICVI